MSEVNRALVLKSIDPRKQNIFNKPGNFTVRFTPELTLESNKLQYLALDHLSMNASWHNIRPEYKNDKLKILKDKGKTFETITFPSGVYHYEDINNFTQERIGNKEVSVVFNLSTYKVFIKLNESYQIDFREGVFATLLGFKKEFLKTSASGENFPNISNSIENLYLRCSLLSDSIISGKRGNVLYTFSTNTKTRSFPFEIKPRHYSWNKINTKYISEVRFYFTDNEDREVDLNDIDISLTVVMKNGSN